MGQTLRQRLKKLLLVAPIQLRLVLVVRHKIMAIIPFSTTSLRLVVAKEEMETMDHDLVAAAGLVVEEDITLVLLEQARLFKVVTVVLVVSLVARMVVLGVVARGDLAVLGMAV